MTKIVHRLRIDLTDAKCREIGRIIAHWSLLEFLMGRAIGNMRGLDIKAGRRLTLQKRVDELIDMLSNSAKNHNLPTDQRREMTDLIKRIETEHERRNDVAHGVWGTHQRQWSLLRYKKPNLVELGRGERMLARDLKRIARRVTTLTQDFEKWLLTLPQP